MRIRITAIAASIVGVVLILVGVAAVLVVRSELYENLDRSLDQRAADVDAATRSEDELVLASSNLEDHFAQVLDAEGRVIAATPNAVDVAPDWPLPDSGTVVLSTGTVPIEDDQYRVLVRASDVDGVRRYTVVGENIDDLRDTIRALVIALAVAIPAALAVLAVTVWWLVGRTLRPVDAIRREVDEIGLEELSRRVPVPGTADEVDRLAATMNLMLDRLEVAAAHQRRFTADASHELRTPLTRMRTQIEVEQRGPSEDVQAVLGSLLDDVTDMQQLVDDLLFLARRDASTSSAAAPRSKVDLDVVVDDEVRAARDESSVAIDSSAVDAVEVLANERDLRRLVRNLLSNAVRHAQSRVVVGLTSTDGCVELVVTDDGPGIPASDRERVFERFVRLDESRSSGGGGSGLGLAIVREIAVAHGGNVHIDDAIGGAGGARLVLRLPA